MNNLYFENKNKVPGTTVVAGYDGASMWTTSFHSRALRSSEPGHISCRLRRDWVGIIVSVLVTPGLRIGASSYEEALVMFSSPAPGAVTMGARMLIVARFNCVSALQRDVVLVITDDGNIGWTFADLLVKVQT